MKKGLSTLSLVLFFSCTLVFTGSAQTPVDVPSSVRFADLDVRFDDGARRIIKQDITALIQSNKKYWEAKLDRVVLYFPLIEAILVQEEVPVDLKYLAVQESSLTPDAVSASTAVGYWQFKKETATDHGMRVDNEVDERKSIVASTRGAARYFKRNNTVYNNWVSSLFSYYLGTTGISKLVPAEWAYAREITLNDKTDRYILRFFAHKIAFENVLPAYRTTNAVSLVEYPYGSGKSVSQVSEDLNIDEVEIRKYNRWILGDNIPSDKEYVLAIPATGEQVAALRRQVQQTRPVSQPQAQPQKPEYVKVDTGYPILRKVNYSKGKPDVVLYEINGLPGIQALAGDNASTLARKARVSTSSFLRYNDMSDRDPITENEVYYLSKKMRKAEVPHHTVQVGETARSISQMYGIRLKKLLRYNRIDRSDRLQVGRVMWLRERRPNRPVEIIKTPASPAPASRPIASQPTTAPAENRVSQSATTDRPANTIPRNASERKLYSPKLVESKDAPAPVNSGNTDSRMATTGSAPASRPAEVTTAPTSRAPVSTPVTAPTVTTQNSGSTQRVVIVRPEGSGSSNSDWDVTPTQSSSTPANRPTERKSPDSSLTNAPVTASARRPATSPVTESSSSPTRSLPTTTPSPRSGNSRSTTHKVEPGQTYYSISRLYGVSVDELLQWNNLTQNDKLAVGQSLVVKGAGEGAMKSQPALSGSSSRTTNDPLVTEEIVYHTVQKGETMYRISRQYGVTVEQIQSWNQLSSGGVTVGQQLKIIKK